MEFGACLTTNICVAYLHRKNSSIHTTQSNIYTGIAYHRNVRIICFNRRLIISAEPELEVFIAGLLLGCAIRDVKVKPTPNARLENCILLITA